MVDFYFIFFLMRCHVLSESVHVERSYQQKWNRDHLWYEEQLDRLFRVENRLIEKLIFDPAKLSAEMES